MKLKKLAGFLLAAAVTAAVASMSVSAAEVTESSSMGEDGILDHQVEFTFHPLLRSELDSTGWKFHTLKDGTEISHRGAICFVGPGATVYRGEAETTAYRYGSAESSYTRVQLKTSSNQVLADSGRQWGYGHTYAQSPSIKNSGYFKLVSNWGTASGSPIA